MSIKGRVTKKKLINFLNDKFKSLGIENFIVTDTYSTIFPGHVLEGGAAKMMIRVELINDSDQYVYFSSSYSLKEIEHYISIGYRIIIKDNSNFGIISNFELDFTKN